MATSHSASALQTIIRAAQRNTASSTWPGLGTYADAGATNLQERNLASYNSALDSSLVGAASVNTTAKLQTMVNAYNAILTLSEGYSGVPVPVPTAEQFAAIGVTGLRGTADGGTALYLMDQALLGIGRANVLTVPQVQAMADAARHVMAAAGGSAAQASALTALDLNSLGITGVTTANLAVVQKAIHAAADSDVDTPLEIQDLINANLGTSQYSALAVIANAALSNHANAARVGAEIYARAGVIGVDSSNLGSINSALNSAAVTGLLANTPREIQSIVDAYNAIRQSADGVAGNTATLSPTQFTLVGVTGVSGTGDAGTAQHLLNNVVDGRPLSAVDTVPELQAIANAANHVMAAVGGTAAQAAAVTVADLLALGLSGVRAVNLAAIQTALQASTNTSAVDTKAELQALANQARGTVAKALATLSQAAQANSATDSTPALSAYADAGATGLLERNLASYNSALNSESVDGAAVNTTAEVMALVDAYNVILRLSEGPVGMPVRVPTAAQYAAIGVTGVSGDPSGDASGDIAMYLMQHSIYGITREKVDTVAEVQAMAHGANHVIAAAAGSAAQAAQLTVADLSALGITGVTADNLAVVQQALHFVPNDRDVDTRNELQDLVNANLGLSPGSARSLIAWAAQVNDANNDYIHAGIYAHAGVVGVNANNLSSINSVLNSVAVTGFQVLHATDLQAIVDAYDAIFRCAAGTNFPQYIPTPAQYSSIGVTGLRGEYAPGTAVYLLDDAIDGITIPRVDTVTEVQALADAASHVMAAVGGTAAQAAAVSLEDLQLLGVSGVTDYSLSQVQSVLQWHSGASDYDTVAELQGLANFVANPPLDDALALPSSAVIMA